MKVRWKQHEIILVNILAVILLIGFLREIHNTPASTFAAPFINNNVRFDLYDNLIFPDLGMGILIYLVYMYLNIFAIPALVKKASKGTWRAAVSLRKFSLSELAKNNLKKYSFFLMKIILCMLILGTALNFATYHKHKWQFDYPGFSIFISSSNQRSQMDIFGSYWFVSAIMGIYFLYVLIRETIIHYLENSRNKRTYRTLIANKVTAFLVLYIAIPVFLNALNVIHENEFYPSYFLVLAALFAMFMCNMYWIFPLGNNVSFFNTATISRLLITSFLLSFPLIVIIHEGFIIALLFSWGFQVFVFTPITWLFFQFNKDKILQLKGTEKELIKSKTDLQFLRSQINPHFLFNILNTLYGTALQENAERTASGIQKLGDMMRFMLRENNLDFIQMSKEIEYLTNYIALQKLRTQSSPDIIIEENISGQDCNHSIAPMLLIPFVENAFKHGISLKEPSWIKINLECTESNIIFEVRNSIHARQDNDPENERSGIGFINVIERLKLIYPGRFQALVNQDEKEFFIHLAIQP
ncbi:MAG TPA: histidine kinase [Puia sp.]|nr:histidine kinase [Puia sp.]